MLRSCSEDLIVQQLLTWRVSIGNVQLLGAKGLNLKAGSGGFSGDGRQISEASSATEVQSS